MCGNCRCKRGTRGRPRGCGTSWPVARCSDESFSVFSDSDSGREIRHWAIPVETLNTLEILNYLCKGKYHGVDDLIFVLDQTSNSVVHSTQPKQLKSKPENTHCTADLLFEWFGFDQTSKLLFIQHK